MSELRRSRRQRGLQPDTQLGLCFICQDELQIEAVQRYIRTDCCQVLLHRSCYQNMTTRAVRCGNCHAIVDSPDADVDLRSYEDFVFPDTPPPSQAEIQVDFNLSGTYGPPASYSGTTLDYYLGILDAEIDRYILTGRYLNCHREGSPTWISLPVSIDHNIWLLYYDAMLNFVRTFPNQPMYIHARANVPVYDTPAIRFTIYSLCIILHIHCII